MSFQTAVKDLNITIQRIANEQYYEVDTSLRIRPS